MKRFLRVRAEGWRSVWVEFSQTPWSSVFGAAVVAAALALPAMFYGMASVVERWAGHWGEGSQISVYLHRSASNDDIQAFMRGLKADPAVARVEYVSPDQGLAELGKTSAIGNLATLLRTNPLPPVVVVSPQPTLSADRLSALLGSLKSHPLVTSVDADLAWAQRLAAAMAVVQRAGVLLAGALAVMVMVVLGNTARLQVLSRQTDIELMRLFGATSGYIRRPFVYAGLVTGALGGLGGWLVLWLGHALIAGPVAHLSALYGSAFTLPGPGLAAGAGLVALGATLGALGARLAVGAYLREP